MGEAENRQTAERVFRAINERDVTRVGASVARPLIEGLKSPTIAREDRLRTLVPFELTTFDDAARLAFAR